MALENAQPFQEANDVLAQKQILATKMSTAQLRDLDRWIRFQSFFSARTAEADYLDEAKSTIESILNPKPDERGVTTGMNPAYARQALKDFLQKIGYQPDPDKRGSLQDLSSDARINLVVKTNVEMAQGAGNWIQSQDAAVLDQFPADELFRLEARTKHRDWVNRFRIAGDQSGFAIGDGWTITPDGRMIALKNHPIWEELGSSDNFDDALDQPWPPFAFNSGMWVRDVDRTEAIAAGIMDRGEIIKPRSISDFMKEAA